MSETVVINRLYHRELIARMTEIEELEKKWNCKIDFPNTEQASDVISISGPEYQVPQALDAFLVGEVMSVNGRDASFLLTGHLQGMVPEKHEIAFQNSEELSTFFNSPDFHHDVRQKLKDQYEVDAHISGMPSSSSTPSASVEVLPPPAEERLVLSYTRNNAGGLKDAIDFLISHLVAYGLDATTVKGTIPRPKSDSFEESLPFFDSKLLQHAPSIHSTDSPTRSTFGDADNVSLTDRASLFDRLRKPGSISSFSSFISRKNANHNNTNNNNNNNNSTGSFFKHASSNASKASLVSMESRDSGYRNPWNDSGVNLPEEDVHVGGWPPRFDTKFPFGGAAATAGDATPRHDPRASFDSGRPSTSHSASGYPVPIGPPPNHR